MNDHGSNNSAGRYLIEGLDLSINAAQGRFIWDYNLPH